ncbi:M61 family metallopeptidase [Stenoxybacter acetivorans]|uniref:M61 family metallopeptidase n=1 Tax=Stenoxybacter acetivorans TaxID=422441 RepID=UPI00055B0F75|nr:PDZ domain-containing protein [Stenoxybacter acetivorans]
MLHYYITPYSLEQHLWQISLCFEQTDDTDFCISLPNWVAGSYLIRDFSRHIVCINASCNEENQGITQINKNTWQLCGQLGHWRIDYRVYAFDVSVRGSFLSTKRGFFDGACLFLYHHNRKQEPCRLTIHGLPEYWGIATALPKTNTAHSFQAANYREFIDYPVEMGQLLRLSFQAADIPHEIVISGHHDVFDHDRLLHDVQRICETELALFDAQPPFTHYVFLLFVGNKIYGGLEHIASTTLMTDRRALPRRNMGSETDDAYINLLGLFSHEYFHAWNVKSIKPKAFADSDLNQEAYTRLLWAFEGITSYYDDLFLVRSGVINPSQYLNLLAKTITRVQQGAGRLQQSLAESSFTAWTKYYRQNENSPNAIVSYYQKGALAALCLDTHIRRISQGQKNLDDVMRYLYRDWQQRHQGLAENEWLNLAEQAVNVDLSDFQAACIDHTGDLPLAESLQTIGIALQWFALPPQHGGAYANTFPAANTPAADFGARFQAAALGIVLTQVFNGGSAEAAGLCANDQIIAINREIISDFSAQWQTCSIGDIINIDYIRDNILYQTTLTVQAAHADTALLSIANQALMDNWLKNETPFK